uniref:Putative transporter YwbF (Trinotate prediction) n=1 Tax=Myxobolus squamalis TaxID=59785 RepID=A0A6B2FZ62_MYXSQ
MSYETEMPEKIDNKAKIQKVIYALKFSYFAYYFSVGCIHNFYPILLKKINFPNSQIGITQAVGLIGGTISPVLIGYLADRTKKSRLILIIITIFTIIFHAIPISTISIKLMVEYSKPTESKAEGSPSSQFLYLLCFFQFCTTFGDQATKALLDGVVHKSVATFASEGVLCDFARLRMFGGIGIGVATFLGGLALQYLKSSLPGGMPEEFCLVFVCIIMGAILIVVLVIYLPDAETQGRVSFLDTFKDVATRVDALICFAIQFTIQFAFNITKQFETLYIQHLGGSKSWIGTATALGYVVDVMMMYLSPTISDAIGGKEMTISYGSMVAMLRTMFYAFADNKYMAITNYVLLGFSSGLIIPTMSSLIKSKSPPSLISSYVSLLTATGKIGAAIASYAGGIISERYSYTMIYVISALTFGSTILLFFILKKYDSYKGNHFLFQLEKKEAKTKNEVHKPFLFEQESA